MVGVAGEMKQRIVLLEHSAGIFKPRVQWYLVSSSNQDDGSIFINDDYFIWETYSGSSTAET
jgi:hypothetical protein